MKQDNFFLDKHQDISVIAMGNFDGLHLGHRSLLEELFKKKQIIGGKSAIITFNPHPLKWLKGKSPCLLMNTEEKINISKSYLAIDEVILINFDEAFSKLSAEEFLKRVLLDKSKIKHVVVGFNFSFGKNGEGDPKFLKDFCDKNDIGVSIVPMVTSKYGIISSTAIREKLEIGNLSAANDMLGYWYSYSGKVIRGRKLGRKLGFKTANMKPDKEKSFSRLEFML